MDKLLGDVLLQFTGVVRLLEYKAEGANLSKERGKHVALKKVLEDRGLAEISREVHWYVETKATEASLNLRTLPYLDAFPKPRVPPTHRLEDLVRSIADDVANQRATYSSSQIRDYLLCVRTINGSTKSGTGGLLLLVEPNGTLRFAPIRDLLDLNMMLSEWINEHVNQIGRSYQLEVSHARDKALSHEHQPKQDRSNDGPDFSR